MKVVYLSLTGNVRRFVQRLDVESIELNVTNPLTEVSADFVFICPTYDDDITDIVSEFLDYKDNLKYLKGFIGSGDTNFGINFVFNAKALSKKYKSPLLFSFEKSGTYADIKEFERKVLGN